MEPLEREDHIKRHLARKELIDEELRLLMGLACRENRLDLYKASDAEFKAFRTKLKK
jgi:hypothetical protein